MTRKRSFSMRGSFQPHSGDMLEDSRLADGLKALAQAIEAAKLLCCGSSGDC